jgi:hypothetical protein
MTDRSSEMSDHLDALLDACDGVEVSTLTTEDVRSALDDIGAAIVACALADQPAPRRRSILRAPRRRSLRLRTALLVSGALLVTSAAVTAGTLMTAHTGQYPTKAEERVSGPGEELNPAAPDFPDVAVQAAADIPYPAGYESWRDAVLRIQGFSPEDLDGEDIAVSTGALRASFAASAYCAWIQKWRQAEVAGDAAAAQSAAQVIAQAPDWKAVVAVDPHPDPSAANDPGAAPGTQFGWMLVYRDAVLAGDRAHVENLLAAGYGDGKCWISDPAWMAEVEAHGDDWAGLSQRGLAQKYEEFLANGRS